MSDVGNVEFPNPLIIPNRPITLSNSTSIIAGKIVASGPFFGLLQDSVLVTLDPRGLVINSNMRVDKKAGGGTAIADGAPIRFTQVAGADWYEAVNAIAGSPIHGYALEAAADGATDILITGPLKPPYDVMGESVGIAFITALATAVDNKLAGQVLVADGADGVGVTDYVVPLVDGNNGEILKQSAPNVVGWAIDELGP